MTDITPYFIVLLFGAVIGSFLNVCIYRLPREESVAWPASHCPSCRKSIAVYDNIPIVSYLLLRGHCRGCRSPISIRYPLVEAANAVGYVGVFWMFGFTPVAWAYAALVSALIVVTGTDLSHTMIPDAVTLPGIVVGLLCAALILPITLMESLMGILVGGGAAVVFGVDQSLCVWERGHGWRRHQAHGHGRRFYRMATGLVGDHDWVVSRIGDRWRAHDFRCHIPSRAHSFRAVPRDWLSPGLDLSSVIIRMVLVPDRLPCVTPQKWLPEPF